MSGYENFGEEAGKSKVSESGEKAVAIASGGKGYKTFDEGIFHVENNTIEFIYSVERYNPAAAAAAAAASTGVANPPSKQRESNMASGYNLHDPVARPHGTSFWISVLRLLLLTCATPIFMIPRFFAGVGYVTGSVLLVAVLLLYVHAMRMILWSAHEIGRLKGAAHGRYSDLLYEAVNAGRPCPASRLSSFVRALCASIFVLTRYSVCVFVLLLAAHNVRTFFVVWLDCELTTQQSLMAAIPVAMALSLLGNVKYLESFAAFGFFCNVVSVALTTWYAVVDARPWRLRIEDATVPRPLYVGVILINISVTPAILAVKSETKNSEQKFRSATGVLNVGYGLILLVYLPFLAACGLKYGCDVPENAVTLLPSDQFPVSVGPIFYGIGLVCVYPYLFCALLRQIADDIFNAKFQRASRCGGRFWPCASKIVAILAAFCCAYVWPNLLLYFSLGGTVCTAVDSIVYPAMVHTVVFWRVRTNWLSLALTLVKNLIILCLGVYLIVMGIEDCLREI